MKANASDRGTMEVGRRGEKISDATFYACNPITNNYNIMSLYKILIKYFIKKFKYDLILLLISNV